MIQITRHSGTTVTGRRVTYDFDDCWWHDGSRIRRVAIAPYDAGELASITWLIPLPEAARAEAEKAFVQHWHDRDKDDDGSAPAE